MILPQSAATHSPFSCSLIAQFRPTQRGRVAAPAERPSAALPRHAPARRILFYAYYPVHYMTNTIPPHPGKRKSLVLYQVKVVSKAEVRQSFCFESWSSYNKTSTHAQFVSGAADDRRRRRPDKVRDLWINVLSEARSVWFETRWSLSPLNTRNLRGVTSELSAFPTGIGYLMKRRLGGFISLPTVRVEGGNRLPKLVLIGRNATASLPPSSDIVFNEYDIEGGKAIKKETIFESLNADWSEIDFIHHPLEDE
ncbi:hypothetical protein EVAR_8527_1 [Eumeta japonica]|uniref:Uncharacterized protein n=1 Tax=Eumeta variegata TaxID=151549 RepID=A0A4C1TXD5_EUMVA|nr:hypothetical protein EVAR_8527_1 [Eumeta japonica]